MNYVARTAMSYGFGDTKKEAINKCRRYTRRENFKKGEPIQAEVFMSEGELTVDGMGIVRSTDSITNLGKAIIYFNTEEREHIDQLLDDVNELTYCLNDIYNVVQPDDEDFEYLNYEAGEVKTSIARFLRKNGG